MLDESHMKVVNANVSTKNADLYPNTSSEPLDDEWDNLSVYLSYSLSVLGVCVCCVMDLWPDCDSKKIY